MTEHDYYAAVRRLGLNPTSVPGVFANSAGDFYSVPDVRNHSPSQRVETLRELKIRLGVNPDEEAPTVAP